MPETEEEKLDEALKFLSTDGARGSSFDFYDKEKSEWNKKEKYLFKHLKEIGIEEYEMIPMIYYLYEDKYIDMNWQPEKPKESGNPPNQIKITFKGIIFIKNGGYENLKKKETYLAKETRFLNWAIGIGTGISGLYVLFQILKWFLKHYHCH